MNNGPELWDAILAEMQPGAIIAGGAVRDYFLGVEPKDIDVFMGDKPTPEASVLSGCWDLSQLSCAYDARSGLGRIDNTYERIEEYAAVTGIVLVSTGTLFDHRVDAIVMDNFDPTTLVEGFDFGITRCWYDGEIHDTPEARNDRYYGTVTMLLDSRKERSLARFDRFNKRTGGGWKLVFGT